MFLGEHLRRGTVAVVSAMVVLQTTTAGRLAAQSRPGGELPTVGEMIDARTDVWGEAAMRQPDGASYEFFSRLLPPLLYVNTDFRYYPFMLSAPFGQEKARLVSNGSAVNPVANQKPMWYEFGTPVMFHVGKVDEPFGHDFGRLDGPRYLKGCLPIVQMSYPHAGITYTEEAFAPVEPRYAERGALMVRFTATGSSPGRVRARIRYDGELRIEGGTVRDEKGQVIVGFEPAWKWQANDRSLLAPLASGQSADLVVFARSGPPIEALTAAKYEECRQACVAKWEDVLGRSIRLTTPEAVVNDAWRSMIIGDFMTAVGDRLHYSAGNAYAKLYQGECGDALRSMLLFGYADAARDMLKPLLEFYREATRTHVAGHKLQLLAWYYWVTRDAEIVRDHEALWRKSLDFILNNREPATGLLPKDRYAGDIDENVYSLNSNAGCWRGLRDVAVILDEIGRKEEAARLLEQAAVYRKAILDAVAKSERLDTKPPFIPIALLADEPAHDPLTATREGSYYDLMIPYVIGSEVFDQGSQREDWLLGYLETHGGIAMGMIRSTPHQGQFEGEPGVNPLYGLRYQLALLRRDEREKALVGFYGQLAQGMTRDTFIGGEGSRFLHGDEHGRSFYLPPNTASNAMFLLTLRYLLIQDWDLNEDGRPDTLRLLYGVPRRWLLSGEILVRDAPSMFGKLSLEVRPNLEAGHVAVRVTMPPRRPTRTLLRLPLPRGWKIAGAIAEGIVLPVTPDGAVDLSDREGTCHVRFMVRR